MSRRNNRKRREDRRERIKAETLAREERRRNRVPSSRLVPQRMTFLLNRGTLALTFDFSGPIIPFDPDSKNPAEAVRNVVEKYQGILENLKRNKPQ